VADTVKPPDPWSEPTRAGANSAPDPEGKTAFVPRSEPAPAPASGGRFAPGELLAHRFRIVRFLGHGGMGDVYEAEDEEVHGRVALKTVRSEIAGLAGALERFTREIRLARKVTHPNVCRIFDISHHGEVTFLTMELLAGETLEQRMRRTGAMREAEALPIARQMAEGLSAAHRVGVVHRDFKPANVMLVPEDGGERAVVMDFGLARGGEPVAGGLTVRGDVLGTPTYMAPEQVAGEEITPATDVYAFGIVLYEMVTGAPPFVGETAMSTAVKRLREDPEPPRLKAPGLSPAWEAAILRCLARDPRQRFAGVRDAAAVLSGEAPPTVGLPRLRRRRELLALAALAVLLATAGGGWWLWRRPRAEAEELAARAQALSNEGKYAEAVAAYGQVRKALAGIGDPVGEHHALGSQGLALGNSGHLEQGLALIRQSLVYFETTKNKDGQANQLINLGTLFQNAGDPEQARNYFVRGMAMAETAGDPSLEALAAFDLGIVFYYQGDLKEAQENLQRALAIRQRLNETDGAIESELYLGEVYLEQDQPDPAVELVQKALEASRQRGNTPSEAEAGALLARIRLKQSNLREARAELDSVERLAETSRDPWIRGVVALAAGYVLVAEGKTEPAIHRLEAALKEDTGSLGLDLRLALGEIEISHGDRQRGSELLQQVKSEAESQGVRLIADKAARALSRM
jgi:tetratricopeptide (TPR) repeat protein